MMIIRLIVITALIIIIGLLQIHLVFIVPSVIILNQVMQNVLRLKQIVVMYILFAEKVVFQVITSLPFTKIVAIVVIIRIKNICLTEIITIVVLSALMEAL